MPRATSGVSTTATSVGGLVSTAARSGAGVVDGARLAGVPKVLFPPVLLKSAEVRRPGVDSDGLNTDDVRERAIETGGWALAGE